MTARASPSLDRLDHRLLALLQADCGRTLEALGDAVGLSPSAVQRRIARYRAEGLLLRQIAVLDPSRFDGVVLAAVLVTLEQESVALHRAFRDRLRAAPEVQQCYDLAGSRDYIGDHRRDRHADLPRYPRPAVLLLSPEISDSEWRAFGVMCSAPISPTQIEWLE